jgi:hypothetical protein
MLNPNVKIPLGDTIHNNIIESFKQEQLKIIEILQVFYLFLY